MSVDYTITPPWRWHWLVNTTRGRAVKCLAWREPVGGHAMREHVDIDSFSADIGELLRGEWELANECAARKEGG